jgi:hypothetical protein
MCVGCRGAVRGVHDVWGVLLGVLLRGRQLQLQQFRGVLVARGHSRHSKRVITHWGHPGHVCWTQDSCTK